jgi:hypothetical protein
MLWLPAATRDERGGFPWQVNCPTKGVLHTTESGSWPDYPPRYHPHATVLPHPGKGVEVRQHVSFDQASYALVHDSGAPTNGAHALQFELVGTCDPNGPKGAYYWPDADDAVLHRPVREGHPPRQRGVRREARGAPVPALPGLAGTTGSGSHPTPHGSPGAGWCGHEHVRGGNVHGDPGAFPWARLVALANGQETDMPLTDDDAIKVARAVHAQKLFGSDVTIGKALYDTYQRPVAPSAAEIAAAIVVAFKALPAGTATVDDATIAKVAQATATELATRLVR